MAKSLIGAAAAAPKGPRQIPLIPAIIGALVCLVLLLVGIAVFRGHDETSPEAGSNTTKANAGSGASTTSTEASKKPKGKRKWDKVNWDK